MHTWHKPYVYVRLHAHAKGPLVARNGTVPAVCWAAKTPHENRGDAVNPKPPTAPQTAWVLPRTHKAALVMLAN